MNDPRRSSPGAEMPSHEANDEPVDFRDDTDETLCICDTHPDGCPVHGDDDEEDDRPPVVPELLASMSPEERALYAHDERNAEGHRDRRGWFEKRCLMDHGFIPHGLTAVGEAERQRAEETERKRMATMGRPVMPEMEFVEMKHTSGTRFKDAIRALAEKQRASRSSEFEIPEHLAEYLYVNAFNFVQFTDAGRVWLGKLQAATALALCLPRETFALSLIDQVAAYSSRAEALRANVPVDPHVCRFFAGIWKTNRRDELLELLPLLCYEHPELEGLPVEWIAGLLNASTMRGPEGDGNRAERRKLTTQERNKKKSLRKAQRNARKAGRRG